MEIREELINKLISIVILVRNEEKRIEDCIKSLITQKHIDSCEIIFVDGNSNDRTKEIINKYVTQHSNIRLIECLKYGYSYQRNVGIENAFGDYILFLSGDVVSESKLILKYINEVKKNNYDIIQGTVLQNGDKQFVKFLYNFYANKMKNVYEDISTVNILIKKSLFDNYKFNEEIIASEDKIWFLLLNKDIKYCRLKSCIVFHNVHESVSQYAKKIYKEALGIGTSLAKNIKLWKKHNYFGWLSSALSRMLIIFLIILFLLKYLLSKDSNLIIYTACLVIINEIRIFCNHKLYKNRLKYYFIHYSYLFCAQVGIIVGVMKVLFNFKSFKNISKARIKNE